MLARMLSGRIRGPIVAESLRRIPVEVNWTTWLMDCPFTMGNESI